MRVSQIALLSLVASTAAPVFAAPISHYRARSENTGASLSAREPEGTSEVTDQNVSREVTPELGARLTTEDLVKILNSRDLNLEQVIQSRSWFDLIDLGANLLGDILRRDVNPESLHARNDMQGSVNSIASRDSSSGERMQARGSYEDFLKLLNTREFGFKRDMQPRGLFTGLLAWAIHKLMSLPIRARDLNADELKGRSFYSDIVDTFSEHSSTSGSGRRQETQARRDGNTSTFLKALLESRDESSTDELAGRSTLSDLADAISKHSSREPSPRQETQARRDGGTSALLEALLRSRAMTDDDVLELLRSRGMDDLD